MAYRRLTTKTITPLLAVLGVGITLVGCSHSGQQESAGSSAAPSAESSSAAAAPAGYDISRVGNVSGDFPTGFTVQSETQKTLTQQDIDNSGVNSFTGAAVDPKQCRALLIPPNAEPTVGAQAAGVRGNSDQGSMFIVAMTSPQPVPVTAPPAGCDHASITGDPDATGTADAIPAPQIDGATTTGVKLTIAEDEDPDYIFTAALDDRTSIVAVGSTDADLNPQQTLSDLLVKAVAAVRGQ